MRVTSTILALGMVLTAAAHPHHDLSAREVAQHQSISKRRASKAGAFTMARKKRSLAKRQALVPRDSSVNITTESPHYSTIQNDTCVLTTEATAGPYYGLGALCQPYPD
ncbi:hypothetical protein K504DRAFT_502318 [Pleomassaria siparia CBS 279.74]|uniref:Uncharacterized protein n=1 Tax=Pleomassaria siparia CBS 279.74 TaxID=1314801 RepID=A0A6G1KAM9_9PLEO|nr:hypothetical protein K504DRAFT_502318 [Pleomassaria siparia CBS 279.74]